MLPWYQNYNVIFCLIAAANVFTKKMHQLRKAELQVKYLPATLPTVYEMDKLLLQDLPDVEDDFLHLFIARCLSLSDEEFSVTHTKNKALLVFSQEYSINGKLFVHN